MMAYEMEMVDGYDEGFSSPPQACVGCESHHSVQEAAPFDVEIHDMELGTVLESAKEGGSAPISGAASVTAMEEESEGGATCTHPNDQEMSVEEQEVTSQANKDKLPVLASMANWTGGKADGEGLTGCWLI